MQADRNLFSCYVRDQLRKKKQKGCYEVQATVRCVCTAHVSSLWEIVKNVDFGSSSPYLLFLIAAKGFPKHTARTLCV